MSEYTVPKSDPEDYKPITDSEPFSQESPLLTGMGFASSPELLQIAEKLTRLLADPTAEPDVVRQLWEEHADQFEALAAQEPNPDRYEKAQIAAILHKAFIFRDAGNMLRYAEELDIANGYVWNAGFTTLGSVLDAEIDRRIANLGLSAEQFIIRLRGNINDANRERLRQLWWEEQDFDSLLSHAYDMLAEEGEDPEEILESLGVLDS